VAVLASNIWGHGPMASAVAPAYKEGLGAEPPAGFRGRAPGRGSGGEAPPEAEALLIFRLLMEAANLPTFLKFGNANKSHICVIFAKNNGWPRNWEGAGAKLGACAPAVPA